ncbi:hypothetical protein [Pseudotamlana agarivorans]|uniref:hypothetical protein n=1 Tax=Pseudotamlana agarivorans TaxID=481183 RepID=UPI000836160F|nr:hypothetical protein [Tamlana agarivorans]
MKKEQDKKDKSKQVDLDVQNNKILKKSENEPESAKDNLDIPGGRTARPLTNDRHQDQKKEDKKPKKEPIENIELDTDPGNEK